MNHNQPAKFVVNDSYLAPGCVDTNFGAKDSYGVGCSDYEPELCMDADFGRRLSSPWYYYYYSEPEPEPSRDDSDFIAAEMCCMCGGGINIGRESIFLFAFFFPGLQYTVCMM